MPLDSFRHIYQNAGAPGAGTNEVQTLTFGGTWLAGDTFVIRYEGVATPAIPWSATNATLLASILAALGALPDIGGTANVAVAAGTLTAGIGTATVTFQAALGKQAVNNIVVQTVTSAAGTLANAETTPGVTAEGKNQVPPGGLVVDTTNKLLYQNSGTLAAPTWQKVGVQT
jgi:hypothetical protein